MKDYQIRFDVDILEDGVIKGRYSSVVPVGSDSIVGALHRFEDGITPPLKVMKGRVETPAEEVKVIDLVSAYPADVLASAKALVEAERVQTVQTSRIRDLESALASAKDISDAQLALIDKQDAKLTELQGHQAAKEIAAGPFLGEIDSVLDRLKADESRGGVGAIAASHSKAVVASLRDRYILHPNHKLDKLRADFAEERNQLTGKYNDLDKHHKNMLDVHHHETAKVQGERAEFHEKLVQAHRDLAALRATRDEYVAEQSRVDAHRETLLADLTADNKEKTARLAALESQCTNQYGAIERYQEETALLLHREARLAQAWKEAEAALHATIAAQTAELDALRARDVESIAKERDEARQAFRDLEKRFRAEQERLEELASQLKRSLSEQAAQCAKTVRLEGELSFAKNHGKELEERLADVDRLIQDQPARLPRPQWGRILHDLERRLVTMQRTARASVQSSLKQSEEYRLCLEACEQIARTGTTELVPRDKWPTWILEVYNLSELRNAREAEVKRAWDRVSQVEKLVADWKRHDL